MTSRLTEKVDVYSFGVVLFEAICGRLPLIRSDAKTGPNTEIHISEWVCNNVTIIRLDFAYKKRLYKWTLNLAKLGTFV